MTNEEQRGDDVSQQPDEAGLERDSDAESEGNSAQDAPVKSDLIQIRRSSGKLEYVTAAKLKKLNDARSIRYDRIEALEKQRNGLVVLCVVLGFLSLWLWTQRDESSQSASDSKPSAAQLANKDGLGVHKVQVDKNPASETDKVYERVIGLDAQQPEPVAKTAVQKEKAIGVAKTKSVEQMTHMPVPKPLVEPEETKPLDVQIRNQVRVWSQAWSNQDVERY